MCSPSKIMIATSSLSMTNCVLFTVKVLGLMVMLLYPHVTGKDPAVIFQYTTESNGDFYLGEELTISCRGENFPPADTTFLSHIYTKENVDPIRVGCAEVHGEWIKVGTVPAELVWLSTLITNKWCEEFKADHEWYIETTLNITEALKEFNLSCRAYAPSEINSVEHLKVTDIKVAPSSLQMNISPATVKEGESFSVECKSTGGNPTSTYDYRITKLGSGEEVTKASMHVTTKADRGGLRVRCVDNQHRDYHKKIETEAEQVIKPAYIDYFGQAREEDLVYTGDGENILNCSQKIVGNPKPEYEWKKNGTRIEGSGSSYIVGNDGNQSEVYECTATIVNFNLSATYQWKITWRDGKDGPGSSVGIIVGVLVGVAVCAGVSIGGYVWWKKKILEKVRVDEVKKDAGGVRGKEEVELARVKAGAANPTTIESSGTNQQPIGPVRKEAGNVLGKQEKVKVKQVKGTGISGNRTTLESSGSTHQQIPLQKKSSKQSSPVKR